MFSAALIALVGFAFLYVGGTDAYSSIVLANRGQVITGQVISLSPTRHYPRVRLGPPLNRDLDLTHSGHPAVGSTIDVRYDPENLGRFEDDRIRAHWMTLILTFAVGAFTLYQAWRFRPRRRR